MKVPFYSTRYVNDQVKTLMYKAFDEVMESQYFTGGEQVEKFEKDFQTYIGSSNFITCANGTDALEIILRTWDIQAGDEVILPALSCQATLEPLLLLGAIPVFCDVLSQGLCIDPVEVEQKITSKTKAIIAVHLHGNWSDMKSLVSLANKYNVKLLEDCAQAHGLKFEDKHAGTWGDAGAFSFYPTKNLGALGEAGGMVFKDKLEGERARRLRNHGQKSKDVHIEVGRNSRMDTLQAAFLSVKLEFLDDWNFQRSQLAAYYRENLIGKVTFYSGTTTVWHQFVIGVSDREKVQEYLKEKGIGIAVHYPYLLPDFIGSEEFFPISAEAVKSMISLPLYPGLTTDEQEYVIKSLLGK